MKPCGPATTSRSAVSSWLYVSVQEAGLGLGVIAGVAVTAGVDVGPGGDAVGAAGGDGAAVDAGEQAASIETRSATAEI
jgi:hypothetical protein